MNLDLIMTKNNNKSTYFIQIQFYYKNKQLIN